MESLRYLFGVFIAGKSLTGKSSFIKMLSKAQHKKVEFIYPHLFDICDRFGNKTSGQLSTVLQNKSPTTDWIVFDGPCEYT